MGVSTEFDWTYGLLYKMELRTFSLNLVKDLQSRKPKDLRENLLLFVC